MSRNVDETYFNDLSRQPRKDSESSLTPPENGATSHTDQSDLPKTKRIACVICRKRKLKCDGNRPKCATCARLGHDCAYDEVRRKSGPKRGYVKELEARLAQVETQLKHKPAKNAKPKAPSRHSSIPEGNEMEEDGPEFDPNVPEAGGPSMADTTFASNSPYGSTSNPLPEAMNTSDFAPDMSFGLDDNFNWEMIGLGLEEPMPTQQAVDELNNIFFEKVHPSLPMIHKSTYYASLSLAPQARPPICLRYVMWALAAMVTEKYAQHDDIFYRRARKYLDIDEMKGVGEAFVTLAHAQTWVLLSTYEFKLMYFPRAWMSCGRASRISLMMGLNRIDGIGMDVKQCLPPPRDWREREERRRTFWMAFCVDRYASIGTGWPMTIDERDIMTALPATDEAYESGTPQTTSLMGEALNHQQIASLSPFAGVVYVTHFFGLNLTHLHRPEQDDDEENLQGRFWKRHRHMDNVLTNLLLALPSHLRLPAGVRDSNVVFINFSAHTSIICLHQAAIFKAQRYKLPQSTIDSSRTRCLSSAAEVVNIMRCTSHLDISTMNPYLVFCLYVSARVLVQYLKDNNQDEETKNSLEFLLTAMAALRKKVPLAESFMIQLQLDIESNGLDLFLHNPDFSTLVKDKAAAHTAIYADAQQPPTHLGSGAYCGAQPPRVHSRQPHDFRAPDTSYLVDVRTPSSARSDDPIQTQYAMGSMQLNARDNAATFPYNPGDSIPEPQSIHGILPGTSKATWGWSSNDSALQGTDMEPVGLNPLINNNIAIPTSYDADMSDQTRPISRNNSTGLTPQSSHSAYQSSSNTSYSPPTIQEDPDPLISSTAAGATTIEATIENSFKVPPGWESGTGLTPGFTGMTPNSAEWEKMMQGIGWEGTGMTPK